MCVRPRDDYITFDKRKCITFVCVCIHNFGRKIFQLRLHAFLLLTYDFVEKKERRLQQLQKT
jgi:hypothetical protein